MQLRSAFLAAGPLCVCAFFAWLVPFSVSGQAMADVSVTPVVVNEKVKPRDILKKELTLANNTSHRVNLYVTVEDVDAQSGEQVFLPSSQVDLATSLAHWTEITRGVIELGPGEVKIVPYLVHVNLNAEPGVYNARIEFSKGTTRKEAEEAGPVASLLLSVEVLDDGREKLELDSFVPAKSVFGGSEATFSFEVENVGNRTVAPQGEIRIFNRRGEEVGTIPLNEENTQLEPQDVQNIIATWDTSGRFGKYKAFLNLEYGSDQLAAVYDTVYFWVFPWKEIGFAFGGLTILAVLGTYILHTRELSRVPRISSAEMEEGDHEIHQPTPQPAPRKPRSVPLPSKRAGRGQRTALHSTISPPQAAHTVALSKKPSHSPEHVVTLAPKRK